MLKLESRDQGQEENHYFLLGLMRQKSAVKVGRSKYLDRARIKWISEKPASRPLWALTIRLAWCLEKDYKNRSAARKMPAIVTIIPVQKNSRLENLFI